MYASWQFKERKKINALMNKKNKGGQEENIDIQLDFLASNRSL